MKKLRRVSSVEETVRALLAHRNEIRQILFDCTSLVTGPRLDNAHKELLCYLTALDQTLPALPRLQQTILHLVFDQHLTEKTAARHLGMHRYQLRKLITVACLRLAASLGIA
jgi:hypothetical protein